uniref:NADH dehydrogenase subunit 4L n=1 Tax=Prosthogonimus cuneatus TaxID=232414 RepID=A0A7L7RYB7_9TREM|nr:NADH dehydrogenase subunit 4L [Prosthogonimus cuneatus]QNU39790.1 NADH dehydrogenase subunit 4L [Prosthogonimus cuneatus]
MFLGFAVGGPVLLLLLGSFFGLFSFFLSSNSFLNCLIVLENMNVLLLLVCLMLGVSMFRSYFVALLVMFTIEVVLSLVVLTRVWGFGSLIGLGCW